MNITNFINDNNIKPADAIVMKKSLFGMLDHYVIYLGIKRGQHIFVANYTQGVKIIPIAELHNFLKIMEPRELDLFRGNYFQRKDAVRRAWSRVGEKAYSYLDNNCEHFKNWVHNGENVSYQAEDAKTIGRTVGGIALGALLLSIFIPKK